MAADITLEPILEPDLGIIDAHHHLWFLPDALLNALEEHPSAGVRALAPAFRRNRRYLLDEFLKDVSDGHHIQSSLFMDCNAMYRADGPDELKSVGEVEFVNGVAAMSASGLFGSVRVATAIVGGVDLSAGESVDRILEAHMQAGGSRYRGIRGARIAYDADDSIVGAGAGIPHLMLDERFHAGFRRLARLGLSFDVFLLEPQLPELIQLARAHPDTAIILNHVGGPVGIGHYSGKRAERFPIWRDNIMTLSRCPNVNVKLGGLGIPFAGLPSHGTKARSTSAQLADEWRPYIETCIEAFGVHRCMFESNFPVDSGVCSYRVLWNAFKRLTMGASREEKAALYSGTAARVYRLEV